MEGSSPSELEAIIRKVIHELLDLPITAHVRELRAKAVTYGRVIAGWATYPPTGPQVQAMHECVAELSEKVRQAKQATRGSKRPSTSAMRRVSSAAPPQGAASTGPPPVLPPDDTGVRSRRGVSVSPEVSTTTSVPPASAGRPIDTPTPAVLRSRRTRG